MALDSSSIKTIGGIADELKSGNYFASGITNINYNVTGWLEDANGLTAARQNMIRDVFKYYSNFLGINFTEVNTSGANTIRFKDNVLDRAFSSLGPNASGQTTINIASNWNGGATAMDSYAWKTAVHEIGHSLGLGHGGHYNGPGVTWAGDAEYWNDTRLLTNMSYFNPNNGDGVTSSNEHSTITGSHINNATMMAGDYYALRDIYSRVANVDAHAGNTTLGFNTNIANASDPVWNQMANNIGNSRFFYTDKATSSYDTVDFSGFGDNQRIDLRVTTEGMTDAYWSNIGGEVKNLAFADHSVFDRAIAGSGHDTVIGNHVNNYLVGLNGDDYLSGRAGADRLYGGAGSDRLFGGSRNDYLNGGWDNDRLYGGTGRDTLIGSTGNDYLSGGSSNDFLSGGSDRDLLIGGSGADNLYGGSDRDLLIGGSSSDYLSGGTGNDYLDGGTSGDRMRGGAGDDTFRVQTGSGYDRIYDFTNGEDRILLGSGSSGVWVSSNNDGDAIVWKGLDMLATVDDAAGQLQISGNYLV